MLKHFKFIFFTFFILSSFSTDILASRFPGTWEYYKKQFISSDGRVIDYYNGKISHSEGQGYGMLISVFNNDRVFFEKIYRWTINNLMVRKDGLSAWRWGKRINGNWDIVDYNNATDGDILISWALFEAWEKWKDKKYVTHALSILKSVRKNLIVVNNKHKLFIPGYFGFNTENRLIVNPSYFVYPAFTKFSRYNEKEFWEKLSGYGVDLTFSNLFSGLKLPADWLVINENKKPVLDLQRSSNFGYEAIRIPLYIAMDRNDKFLKNFIPYLKYIKKIGYIPVVVDIKNEQVSIKKAPAGFYAVVAMIAKKMKMKNFSKKLMDDARIRINNEGLDYYSHTLFLLAKTVK